VFQRAATVAEFLSPSGRGILCRFVGRDMTSDCFCSVKEIDVTNQDYAKCTEDAIDSMPCTNCIGYEKGMVLMLIPLLSISHYCLLLPRRNAERRSKPTLFLNLSNITLRLSAKFHLLYGARDMPTFTLFLRFASFFFFSFRSRSLRRKAHSY
jgi:hypothetical protein